MATNEYTNAVNATVERTFKALCEAERYEAFLLKSASATQKGIFLAMQATHKTRKAYEAAVALQANTTECPEE